MSTERADFHVHYDPRDKDSAFEVVDKLLENDVKAVALLARSEISNDVPQIVEYGESRGIDVIPGIEYFSRVDGVGMDLILLGFDPGHESIIQAFGPESRLEQNKELAHFQMRFLQSKGFVFNGINGNDKITFEELLGGKITQKAITFCRLVEAQECNRGRVDQLISENREEWETALAKYPYLDPDKNNPESRVKFIWYLYFAEGKEGFVPVQLKPDKVIDTIHTAGGVVLYSPEGDFERSTWERLKDKKIDGIMAWHGDRLGLDRGGVDVPMEVILEAHRSGLLVLGGSDYQGKDFQPGNGNGNMYISLRRFRELVDYISLRNDGNLPWVKQK